MYIIVIYSNKKHNIDALNLFNRIKPRWRAENGP